MSKVIKSTSTLYRWCNLYFNFNQNSDWLKCLENIHLSFIAKEKKVVWKYFIRSQMN